MLLVSEEVKSPEKNKMDSGAQQSGKPYKTVLPSQATTTTGSGTMASTLLRLLAVAVEPIVKQLTVG